MAGYKKVILTERRNSLTATTEKDVSEKSQADLTLEKFDTNYSNDKLNSIYNEYESIVISPQTNTLTKKDAYVEIASKSKIGFKTKVIMVSASMVVALLLFLAIFNIFVINSMNSSISIVEGNVATQEQVLNDLIEDYNGLNNQSAWEEELRRNGYEENGGVKVKLKLIQEDGASDVSYESNWFDKLCDFLSQLFGG